MKNLFKDTNIEGFMVFSHKKNWKTLLSFIAKTLEHNHFFFFFDSERGYHLKIFVSEIQKNQLNTITSYLKSLPLSDASLYEDPLFVNVPENSLHTLKYIPYTHNLTFPENITSQEYFIHLKNLSAVVIGALQYNDFFVEEKNRINFAIQLVFLALVKADKTLLMQELAKASVNFTDNISSNSPLFNFYKEIQLIETEENIEEWVINWLINGAEFLNKTNLHTLIGSICMLLEIRGFTDQLYYTTKAVLNY
ncbi:MAG: hypothetical protein ACOVO2_24495 [Emticicia sp.]|uniref:hypothetical protein n=1 Tax=Emticicia sp. TaxID=1930953 RepID=UPI003BA75BBF